MKVTPLATWPGIPKRVGILPRGTHPAEQKTHLAISSSGKHAPIGRLQKRELAEILAANGGIRANVQHRSVRKPCVLEGRSELKQREHRAATRLAHIIREGCAPRRCAAFSSVVRCYAVGRRCLGSCEVDGRALKSTQGAFFAGEVTLVSLLDE